VKKPAVRKPASRRPAAAKPARAATARPAAARAAKRTVARPAARRPQATAARPASAAAGAAALKHVVDQLEVRLSGVERQFEQAKQAFEEASRARSTELGHGRQANRDLNAYATDLRLLTVRRTELLWMKRLLEGGAL
jgi:hypothetical protein